MHGSLLGVGVLGAALLVFTTAASKSSVPLRGPVGRWSWFDVPGAICGDGSQTGVGVNMGTGTDLVIILDGGGLCWNQLTCTTKIGNTPLAYHVLNGFHEDDATARLASLPHGNIIDRTVADSPFKNSTFVYIPYCTGDLHSGSTTQKWTNPIAPYNGFTMHYAGATNIAADLARIAPSFKNATHVTLYGASAGGYGAVIHYERVKRAFGKVVVDLVDDAGPVFPESELGLARSGFDVWNLRASVPPACTECRTDVHAIYSYLARTYPDARFAFTEFDRDNMMALFTFQEPADSVFAGHLRALTEGLPKSNWRYFIPDGTKHGVLSNLRQTVSTKSEDVSPPLTKWLTNMIRRSGDWVSYTAE
jgi:hypothetical protein